MRVIHGTLEALKVWQALCFRDISQKQTRKSNISRPDSKGIGEMHRTPGRARYLHPLLPDPPPILLKHVTKTSIAVPALPVIKPRTTDPSIPWISMKSTIRAASLHDSRPPGSMHGIMQSSSHSMHGIIESLSHRSHGATDLTKPTFPV